MKKSSFQKNLVRTGMSKQAITQKAFTLVELLVVISIIALLLGILMPALSAARSQAQKTVCQTRMRQWAVACFTYAASDTSSPFPFYGNKCLPPYTDAEQFSPWWWETLASYVGKDTRDKGNNYHEDEAYLSKIRKCPAGKKVADISTFDLNPWSCWIGINWGQGNRSGIPIAAPFFWKEYVFPGIENIQLSANKVKNPGETMMFLDARTQHVYNLNEFPLLIDLDRDGVLDSSPLVSTTGLGIPYNAAQPTIHGRGCNVTLLDGHVEYITREELFEVDRRGYPLHSYWKIKAN